MAQLAIKKSNLWQNIGEATIVSGIQIQALLKCAHFSENPLRPVRI